MSFITKIAESSSHPLSLSFLSLLCLTTTLGAAYFAASLSASHRIKEFRMKDASLAHFPVVVTATPEGQEKQTPERIAQQREAMLDEGIDPDEEDSAQQAEAQQVALRKTLFPANSRYGGKKALTFNGSKKFTIGLEYLPLSSEALTGAYPPGTLYVAAYVTCLWNLEY